MNLNPETTVHDDMYNVKYRQHDTVYQPMFFEPLKQTKVSHSMFKVTSFVDFGPYLKSLSSLVRYTKGLKEQLTNIMKILVISSWKEICQR